MAVKFTRTVAGLRQELSFDELAALLDQRAEQAMSVTKQTKYFEGKATGYATAAELLREFKVEEYDDAGK